MLKTHDLTLSRNGRIILDRVDVNFLHGKTSLILGRNGSGKSTLLKTLAGLLTPDSGEVILNNTPLHKFSRREIARQCAVLLQEPTAPPDMTVQMLVSLGRFPHDPNRAADREAVHKALDEMGITELSSRQLGTLSGGERRKAFFARALAQESKLLILDEPDAALDAAAKGELLQLLQRLKKHRQLTIVMAAHDWDFALNAADCVCGLKDGRVCCTGTPDEIAVPETLQELFGISGITFHDRSGKLRILPEY